ncbi:MAG TPA: CVNH domain-containing protein [Rhizomicrobium sp.]|jgi:hypothetical protein
MIKYTTLSIIAVAGLLAAGPASANSSFTQTCSNIGFAYSGSSPTLVAVCLNDKNAPHATSLVLKGISNDKGLLTLSPGGGTSSFQMSCGSIKVDVNGPVVTLSAYCKVSSTQFNSTSLSLNNINNSNGNLVQN